MFDLSVSEEKNCKIFHLKGRLMDQQQADHLMKALDDELSGGNHTIILDLGDLQYMNSTGLNILINVLTRPLGAVVGDFLDKPVASGGLALSRYSASVVLLVFIFGCIMLFKHEPAGKRH